MSPSRSRWGGRLAAAAPAAAIGLLLVVAFHGPLAGRLFYLRDIVQNHYPIRHVVTEMLLSGSLPLWDPYHGGGTPLLANPDNLVLTPMSVLPLFLPFDAAFTASILLHYVLLALGGYLLARSLRVGRPAAALASAIVSLSGPAASLASMQNLLAGAAWVPLALWAFVEGLRAGRRWLLAIASGCVAIVLMTGEVASIAGFVVLAAILGLTEKGEGPAGEMRMRVPAALGLVLLLGAALAAAQILPARELLAMSARGGGFAYGEGMKWSLEPARMAGIVLPRLFGDPTRLAPENWWGSFLFEGGYPFLLSIYLGAIPCLLAFAGATAGRAGEVRGRALAAASAFFVLLALGGHSTLYRLLFEAIPVVRRVRYPERFMIAATLAVALLAALGLDRLLDSSRARGRAHVWLGAVCAVLFVAVTVVAAAPSLLDGFLARAAGIPETLLLSDSGAVVRGGVLRSLLWMFGETLVLAVGISFATHTSTSRWASPCGWGIVILSGLSMTAAAAPALSSVAPGWLKSPSPLAPVVEQGPGAARLHHEPRPPGLSVWGTTDELAWGYRFDRFTYALASGHLDRVPTVLDPATDRMDLAPQADLGRALQKLPLDGRLKILALCHTGFVLSFDALEHPGLEPGPVLEGLSRPPARIYRVRGVLPRARFVPRAAPPSYPGDLARSLADPAFDPQTTVLLENARAADPDPGSHADGNAVILEERPESVRLMVDAPTSGYLVLSDAWAPGWRALLDGGPAGILKANGLFRAVRVGPGRHEVVMSYRPLSVRLGLATSAAALLVTCAWGFAMKRRKA